MAASFTRQQVSEALNEAADDVLSAIDAPDEGVRDAINLVVNAAITYLDSPGTTLEQAIEANYDDWEPGNGPIEWSQR